MTTQTKQPPVISVDGGGSHGDASPPPPARSRRPFVVVVVAIAVIVALVFGIRYLLFALVHQTTDDAMIDADPVAITSKITERVDRLLVDTNQPVVKGELLLQLDDRDERQKLAQAIAQRDQALAQVQAAQANVALTQDQQNAQNRQGQGAIQQAQAAISSAVAQRQAAYDAVPAARENLRKAEADLQRISSLVATGDLARSELDSARAAEAAAQSSYTQALANARTASSQVPQQHGQLTAAQGRLLEKRHSQPRARRSGQRAGGAGGALETAESQVRFALDQLAYTQVRAPVDGIVGEKNVEIGATVSPGQAIMQVVPSSRVFITANYKETQLGSIKIGQPVEITIDAYHGKRFSGKVEAISPASQNLFSLIPAQNATGNFVKVTQRVPVRVVFVDPDPAYPLRPGMSVETSIATK